jgi:hypothetical protein
LMLKTQSRRSHKKQARHQSQTRPSHPAFRSPPPPNAQRPKPPNAEQKKQANVTVSPVLTPHTDASLRKATQTHAQCQATTAQPQKQRRPRFSSFR